MTVEADVMTTGEAGGHLGLTGSRVWQLARTGRISALRTEGGRVLVTRAEVERLVAERAAKSRA